MMWLENFHYELQRFNNFFIVAEYQLSMTFMFEAR